MKRIDIYAVKQVKESGKNYELDNAFINSPEDAAKIIEAVFSLSEEPGEVFGILNLNIKHKISGAHIVTKGTLNTSLVHPREVFRQAILNNAAGFVLFHNHPSGDATPSREDIEVTRRLIEAGRIIGIEVLDHVVIGDGGKYVSFREKGLMPASYSG